MNPKVTDLVLFFRKASDKGLAAIICKVHEPERKYLSGPAGGTATGSPEEIQVKEVLVNLLVIHEDGSTSNKLGVLFVADGEKIPPAAHCKRG